MHTQDKLHRHTAHELIPKTQSFISLVLRPISDSMPVLGGGGGENGELLLSPCSDGRDLTHCWQNVSISPSVLSCLIFSPGFLMPCEFQPQFYTDVTKGPGKAELLLVVLPGNCAVRLAFHPPQRTCIIRVQMGCEWKHVLLYMANLPYPVPMCTICFQCRGRPDVYFKVF